MRAGIGYLVDCILQLSQSVTHREQWPAFAKLDQIHRFKS